MPSIPLSLLETDPSELNSLPNHLPALLQTPSGLAILEIQGTIHAPFPDQSENNNDAAEPTQTAVGRLEFPLYDPSAETADTKWMKRVYLYVGRHQRLTGEVKKLPKALIVVNKKPRNGSTDVDEMEVDGPTPNGEELEILEVIKYKILFGGRPEPVGD